MNYHLEGDFSTIILGCLIGFGDWNDEEEEEEVLGFDHGHIESFHGHPLHHTTRKLTCDLGLLRSGVPSPGPRGPSLHI